jgi:demethylmenaquinone methyltransferase/2-methoxy-6-polyprenyl-1,4-benzoquinol methylase
MTRDILQEQIAYYDARANEYDEWFYRIGRYDRGSELNQRWFNEVVVVRKALNQVGKVNHILELACGTGIWTQELLNIGEKITALDASTKVIDINQRKLNSSRVQYHQQDLFSWKPDAEYDLVFFAFWLSHVPPELLSSFLGKVWQSVRVGGQVFLIDSRFEQTSTAKNHTLSNETNICYTRKLNDGREYQVVKVFYQPDTLTKQLSEVGFSVDVKLTQNYFIYARGIKPE